MTTDPNTIMHGLFSSIYEVNERIMTGDYSSPKFAIGSKMVREMMLHHHDLLSSAGCTDVSLQLYVAAGGWVGIQYSYVADNHELSGSVTPRRQS